jgi:Fe-S-cluster containining protein
MSGDKDFVPAAHRAGTGDLGLPEAELADGVESVWFACQRCTNCCRWPGQVRLTEADITRIAAFLGMSEWDFIQNHTRLQPSRRGLALLEQEDGACEFLEGRDCRIQPVKPEQCRGFPNEWNFPGWREVCEAIPVVKNPVASH